MTSLLAEMYNDIQVLKHKLVRLIEFGEVVSQDPKTDKVLVRRSPEGDPIEADPINLATGALKTRATYSAGAPVLLFRVSADGKKFCVFPAPFTGANPSPSDHSEELLTVLGQALFLLHADRIETTVDAASVALTKDQVRQQVGGASIKIRDGQIVLSASKIVLEGEVLAEGDKLTHNGKNVGENHNHKDVKPGKGISGDPV